MVMTLSRVTFNDEDLFNHCGQLERHSLVGYIVLRNRHSGCIPKSYEILKGALCNL